MRLPPSSSSSLGSPPMRVLRPPTWITPVIFIVFRSPRTVGTRSQTRLAWRLRLAQRPHDVLRLALPSFARLGRWGLDRRLASPGGCGSHSGPTTSCGSHYHLSLASDGGDSIADSPRLAAAARTAAPRRPAARTTIFRSPRTVGTRSQTRLAWRLRLAQRPHDVLRLALPRLQCNGSLTKDAGRVDGDVDDRGGRTAGRWAPVEHQVEHITEVSEHAVGGR